MSFLQFLLFVITVLQLSQNTTEIKKRKDESKNMSGKHRAPKVKTVSPGNSDEETASNADISPSNRKSGFQQINVF